MSNPVGKHLFPDTSSADHITGSMCLPRVCMLSCRYVEKHLFGDIRLAPTALAILPEQV
ncbi:MAG: hypothetical protein L0H15_06485 [Nitrosospira sp.]|nr:hypothetical protein [Nitrosospira sp.]